MPDYSESVLGTYGVDLSKAEKVSDDVTLFTIPGGVAASRTWAGLAAKWKELGGWPILCGPEKERSLLLETLANSPKSTAEILTSVPVESPSALFERRQLDELPNFPDDKDTTQHRAMVLAEPDFSSWPISLPEKRRRRLHGTFDHRGKPFEKCLLALIQPTHWAHAPAYLRFGDLNDCPSPALHVAQLKDWFGRFGAVPVVITQDVIEICIGRPITDPRQAFQIAKGQYFYCTDIVDQGIETVANLASEIWNQRFWYFWWDEWIRCQLNMGVELARWIVLRRLGRRGRWR